MAKNIITAICIYWGLTLSEDQNGGNAMSILRLKMKTARLSFVPNLFKSNDKFTFILRSYFNDN